MKTLRLSIAHHLAISTLAQVPVEIVPLHGKGRSTTHLTPLGGSVDIPLESGIYLLRARLPNGDMIQEQVTLQEMGTKVIAATLQIAQEVSPNETAAWAYVLQQPSRFARSRHESRSFRGVVPVTDSLPKIGFWERLAEQSGSAVWNQLPDVISTSRTQPYYNSNALAEYEVDAPHEHQVYLATPGPAGHREPCLTRIPPSSGRGSRLLLYQDPDGADPDDMWDIRFDTGNEAAMTLWGFMAGDDLNSARMVGSAFMDEAVGMMQAKQRDYTNAIIAAYFLLKAANWSDDELSVGSVKIKTLRSWLGNLSAWFPAQPDGAIIRGAALLDQGHGQEAKNEFLTAAQRGLPCFALGLRTLADGLRYVQSVEGVGEDARVDATLREVDAWLTASVKDSPLTSVRTISKNGHMTPRAIPAIAPKNDTMEKEVPLYRYR